MAYSDFFMHRERRVPLPIVLVAVLMVIFVLARLMNSSPPPSRATRGAVVETTLANVGPTSVSVYWKTSEKVKSWLTVGENENALTRRTLDIRDVPDSLELRQHFLTELKNLEPGKTYYYAVYIQKGDDVFMVKQNDSFYSVTTALSSIPVNNKPAYGKVVAANESPVVGGIVRLTLKSAYPQMTLTKSTGEWLIPLNGLVDKVTGKGITVSQEDPVVIEILTEDAASTVKTVASLVSPLPQTVILGKDYTFSDNQEVLAATDTTSSPPGTISVLTPKENAVIPGRTLLVRGTALPASTVTVQIKATKQLDFSVVADEEGIWKVPLDPLLPGSYTLTMKTKNEDREDVVIERHFTIAKSGEQVLGSATDSATPTVAPSPTVVASPTTIYNTYPTATPYVATDGAGPVAGTTSLVPWILTAGGIVIIIVGAVLAF